MWWGNQHPTVDQIFHPYYGFIQCRNENLSAEWGYLMVGTGKQLTVTI
jgi:hypothetical protein